MNDRKGVGLTEDEDIMLTFPQALERVIDGSWITKEEWKDQTIYVCLKDGFLRIVQNGKEDALSVSEGDLLGTDWKVLK